MSIDQNGKKEQVVPFFLDKTDLQNLLDRASKDQPDVTKATKIKVASLFQVLDSMVSKDNKPNPEVERFQFVPSRSSFEYILKNTKQSATPQVAPAKK
jgi:nickel transport protein